MNCQFQIFQVTGSEINYTQSENMLLASNMEVGPVQDSILIPNISVLPGQYRIYATAAWGVTSFKIAFFEDGSSSESGNITNQIDTTCDHDSVGYYRTFTVPITACRIDVTLYDQMTNDYELVANNVKVLLPTLAILGEWVDFGSVVSPLLIGDTLTADTSTSFTIKLYMSGEVEMALESLTPGTFCRINFGTKKFDYVIVDGGRIEPKTGTSFCYHSYSVQEMICYSREIYTQPSFFSFNRYTVPDFFKRLFALSKSDMSLALSVADDYATLLENWKSPDYQVASCILLDNMIKVGMNNAVRMKARINASNHLEFYAKSLRGNTEIQSINGIKLGDTKSFLGANYAGKVIANVENMTSDSEQWYPEDDCVFGGLAEPDSDELKASSEEDIVWVLPFKIRSASAFRAIGCGYCFHDDNGSSGIVKDGWGNVIQPPLIYSDFLRNPTGIVVDIHIVEFGEWRTLDVDGSQGATFHQGNTVYYFRGENKIHNLKVVTGVADGAAGHFSSDPTYYEFVGNEWVPVYQVLYPGVNYYVIKADLYMDGVVRIDNRLGTNRTAIYTQEENLVSGKSFLKNMQGYIDGMKNQERQLTYEFSSMDDVPEVGNIYEGMVISTVALEVVFGKIVATMTLSDELVKKSEYLSADGGLVLPPIPSEKAFKRSTNYTSNIWLCRTQALATAIKEKYGMDNFLQSGFMAYAFNGFANDRSIKGKIPAEILLKTGEVENDIMYTALDVAVKVINETLFISWATRNNLSAGNMVDRNGNYAVQFFHYFSVAFIGLTGMSKIFRYKLFSDSVRGSEPNFPAVSAGIFNGSSPLVVIDDLEHYHDPAEQENGILQINFIAENPVDKINQRFIEESSLLNDTLYQDDIHLRYAQIAAINYIILSTSISKITDGIFRVYVVFEIPQGSALTTGSFCDAKFVRINTSTLMSETMLEMNCLLQSYGSPNAALVFYVALTK